MKRVAIIKGESISCYECSGTFLPQFITTWREVDDETYSVLSKWISGRENKYRYSYDATRYVLIEDITPTDEFDNLVAAAKADVAAKAKAEADRLKKEAERRKDAERKKLESKRKKLEKLKAELGDL